MSLPVPETSSTRRERFLTHVNAVLPVALAAASVVVVAAGLHGARAILAPLALAVFAAIVSLPLMQWLRRLGIPPVLAILLVMLLNASVLTSIGWIVVQTINEVRVELPTYLERGQALEASLREWLASRRVFVTADTYATLVQPDRLLDLVTVAARNLTSVLALLLLILLYLVFVLLETITLPVKIQHVLRPSERMLEGGIQVLAQLQRYLFLKTLISFTTGSLVAAAAAFLDVDFALFWGLLAFLLNYIPTVGSFVAAIPAVLVALLQLGPGTALALAIAYLVVNVVVGSMVDPILIGRELRLSPIVVLVSLVFWGWAWGPIGAFLSVPLTVTIRMVMERTRSLRLAAAMMGPLEDAVRATDPMHARP
jgi:AI-2 transport protein TqsA